MNYSFTDTFTKSQKLQRKIASRRQPRIHLRTLFPWNNVKHMCQAFEQDTWELSSLSEGQQPMDISNMGSLNMLVVDSPLYCFF